MAQCSRITHLINEKKYQEAEIELEKIKKEITNKRHPKYLLGWWFLQKGDINFAKGRYKQAKNQYVRVLDIALQDGTDPVLIYMGYYNCTCVSMQLEDVESAQSYIDKGLDFLTTNRGRPDKEMRRHRVRLLLLSAELSVRDDQLGKAEKLLSQIKGIIDSIPDTEYEMVQYSVVSGMLNFKQGNLLDAELYLTGAMKLMKHYKLESHIDEGNVLYFLGRVNIELGRLDKAIGCLKQAIKIDESRPQSLWRDSTRLEKVYLTLAYIDKQEYSKAVQCCDAIISSLNRLPEMSPDQKNTLKKIIETRKNLLKKGGSEYFQRHPSQGSMKK